MACLIAGWTLWERRSKGMDIMGTKVKDGGCRCAGSVKEKGLSPKAILFTDGTQKMKLSEDEISQCFILCLFTAR